MAEVDRSGERVLRADRLGGLIAALRRRGYRVIGPTLRDGAVLYDEVESADELPRGWTDAQAPGRYRLERRADDAFFGFAVGPHSWRRFLQPPEERLWTVERREGALAFSTEPRAEAEPPLAFVGVRACELEAIAVQDRVLASGEHVDGRYARRRGSLFVVAVECSDPSGTCFCVSMGTGPAVRDRFDLRLTELLEGGEHRFLVAAGTEAGASVLEDLETSEADVADREAAARVVERAGARMGRRLETDGLRELLYASVSSPHWAEVGERCLACASCTLVCPTCFCTTNVDTTDPTTGCAERCRRWDSCFTLEFSYVHGGPVRSTAGGRYRQWMTHKLASWFDQFGSSGCVGCGRCITWCPVGIDLTAEASRLRERASAAAREPDEGERT